MRSVRIRRVTDVCLDPRRAGGVVLAYHDVVPNDMRPGKWNVHIASLKRDIRMLRLSGFRFVPLSDLVDRTRTGLSTAGLAAVTFDDAIIGVRELAVPFLIQEAVPATIFVVTQAHGTTPSWWEARRTLRVAELQDLVLSNGITLAPHGRTHRALTGLEQALLDEEIAGSKHDIELLTGRPAAIFAYPFGEYDAAAADAVRRAGMHAAFGFRNGRIAPTSDLFSLPRMTMSDSPSQQLRLMYWLLRSRRSWHSTA